MALYMKSSAPSWLYLGFHERDFPENSELAITKHAVRTVKFTCDQSVIKDTLREEKCALSTVSRLPLDGFSWKCTRRPTTNAQQTVKVLLQEVSYEAQLNWREMCLLGCILACIGGILGTSQLVLSTHAIQMMQV
jgi:hypothetical protein